MAEIFAAIGAVWPWLGRQRLEPGRRALTEEITGAGESWESVVGAIEVQLILLPVLLLTLDLLRKKVGESAGGCLSPVLLLSLSWGTMRLPWEGGGRRGICAVWPRPLPRPPAPSA